ncbi:hypothetical protein KIN20_033883 [Parelaphostrongylus tenuis]|uniref:MPN domain-containing protein n=1 Tax=Parelaphostrongylus tenuis TaxID=148309 RepID=A0AAD5R909_PARTN|nr:hypothetical protein KIN20_033883 [Parelaphostrongylus tenuis]
MTVDVAVVPYATVILHCLKYPHSGVLGILLGSRSGNKVKVSAAVPLSHESSPLAPSLEVALAIIHASYPNIVGVYFSNQNYKDRSLNPYAVRLCENVTSVCGTNAVLMQVINWNLSADCENNSLEAYVKDGESWKDTRLDTSSDSLTTLSRAIYNKLYRNLSDFENHLDRPESDFYNTVLSQKLGQLIG